MQTLREKEDDQLKDDVVQTYFPRALFLSEAGFATAATSAFCAGAKLFSDAVTASWVEIVIVGGVGLVIGIAVRLLVIEPKRQEIGVA